MPYCKNCGLEISERQAQQFNKKCPECVRSSQQTLTPTIVKKEEGVSDKIFTGYCLIVIILLPIIIVLVLIIWVLTQFLNLVPGT